MVEFAVILPALILLLLAGADLLMAISDRQQVSYVAQETAQWCAANGCSATGQAQTFARQLALINPNNVSATTNGCSGTGCVSVTVRYSFTSMFHFFPSFTMTSTAVAYPPSQPPPPSS